MHNSLLMHMFERTRNLFHVVPDHRLIELQFLAFFFFDQFFEITAFSPFRDDNELVVMDERVNILDDVRMVQFLHDVYLFQTLIALLLVCHIENLYERSCTLIFFNAKGSPC